jgi:hypothetical protein
MCLVAGMGVMAVGGSVGGVFWHTSYDKHAIA